MEKEEGGGGGDKDFKKEDKLGQEVSALKKGVELEPLLLFIHLIFCLNVLKETLFSK